MAATADLSNSTSIGRTSRWPETPSTIGIRSAKSPVKGIGASTVSTGAFYCVGSKTAFTISPECMASNAWCHSAKGETRLNSEPKSNWPEESKRMTRSQIGQLCEKLPCNVTAFKTKGSSEKLNGCGPQPTLQI